MPVGNADARASRRLAAAGYKQYEESGYARAGHRCVHNLNYWQFGDYLGIGAGAHGKITDAGRGVVERTAAVRQPRQYLDTFAPGADSPAGKAGRAAIAAGHEHSAVASEDLPFEFMLNALRLVEGFSREQFESRTGLALDSVDPVLDAAQRKGLLECPRYGALAPDRARAAVPERLAGEFSARAPHGNPRATGKSTLIRHLLLCTALSRL